MAKGNADGTRSVRVSVRAVSHLDKVGQNLGMLGTSRGQVIELLCIGHPKAADVLACVSRHANAGLTLPAPASRRAGFEAHDADLDRVRAEHAAELERVRAEHAAELERVRKEHKTEVKRMQTEHAAAVKDAHARGIAQGRSEGGDRTGQLALEGLQECHEWWPGAIAEKCSYVGVALSGGGDFPLVLDPCEPKPRPPKTEGGKSKGA